MKYRALFLIKLGYYLEGKKINLNSEIYSLFINFSFECTFLKEQIKMIEKMMVLKEKKLEAYQKEEQKAEELFVEEFVTFNRIAGK